jgi:hypothetical protein
LVFADLVAVAVGVIWLLTVKKAIVPETGNISHRLGSAHRCNSTIGNCWAQVGMTVRLYKTKLHGLSPRANYTDRAATAGRRS